MSEEKETLEEVSEEEVVPVTGWAKMWLLMKRYGLVSIFGTIMVSAGTWAFTTIDNLKDENITLKQQMVDNKYHREAMWMRLYYYMDQQQRLGAQVEVNKQLYNMLVYSKKELKDLPRLANKSIDNDPMKPKTYQDFKRESLMQMQPAPNMEQRTAK